MNIAELIEQLNQFGELETIEAKAAEHQIGKSVLETVCAFANEPDLKGGYLLLGIKKTDDDGMHYVVTGVKDPEKIRENLVSQCRNDFNTPVQIEIHQEIINDKIVMCVFVPEANPASKPIYFKSQGLPRGAFRRMGSSDVHCTEDDLLLLYQNRNNESYDYTLATDAEWSDIDLSAVTEYRRERAAIHPDAKELSWSDEELLQSLACVRKVDGIFKPSIAGILLFGTEMAYRRLFSTMRVDYIREPGVQWISNINNRFTSVEIRGPLMRTIRRALSAILDDLPKVFSLPEGSIQRQDIPIIPPTVIREAVVNAIMHRNYRSPQAIQIIRYANRIEVRNPGYSLVSDEHFGEPGSKCRNPKIADVLHETHFAENKGSGIRIMRENMRQAGLSQPVFQSDRNNDMFIAIFLFHHFLGEDDIKWLGNFKKYKLSDEQARALIFVREVGAIDNSAYRNFNQIDTLTASIALRQLRDHGLLTAKNKGPATYYLPGEVFMDSLNQFKPLSNKGQTLGQMPSAEGQMPGTEGQMPGVEGQMLGAEGQMLGQMPGTEGQMLSAEGQMPGQMPGTEGQMLSAEGQMLGQMPGTEGQMPGVEGQMVEQRPKEIKSTKELPDYLQDMIGKFEGRVPKTIMEKTILELCKWKEMTAVELSMVLGRDKPKLTRIYLSPMVEKGLLVHKYPEMPKHPNQTYKTK